MSCARGCRRALPWLRGPQCARCALPLTARHACPAARQAFDAAWAAVGYAGVARDLVAALKFRRAPPAGRRHGGAARRRRAAAPLLAGATIVPVPAHPSHVRARGYDQAEAARRRARAPHGRAARPAAAAPRARAQPARRIACRAPGAGADRRLRPWPGPGPGGAGRRRAHDGRHARRVRPSAASGGGRRGRRADLGARSPGRIPVAPTGSALTPVNESRTISSKGSKRLNGGASYADRGQGPEHPRHG